MEKELVYGDGYRVGVPAGIHEAIHRINDLAESYGDSIPVDVLIEYIKKDAQWAMQDFQGWDGVEIMDNMGDWKPGWWAIDHY